MLALVLWQMWKQQQSKNGTWFTRLTLIQYFLDASTAIPLMRDSGNGSIINVSSISGIVAGHNFAAYNSAKAAVRHLTKSVALHCARTTDLVRCNSVHPVFAKTEMMKSFFENPTDELISKIERQIPVRKTSDSERMWQIQFYFLPAMSQR